MIPDLKNMMLPELLDLLSLKTSELLKAIDRRNRMANLKELKKEVETIQATIKFQEKNHSVREYIVQPGYSGQPGF
jgi:hypothetical protein